MSWFWELGVIYREVGNAKEKLRALRDDVAVSSIQHTKILVV